MKAKKRSRDFKNYLGISKNVRELENIRKFEKIICIFEKCSRIWKINEFEKFKTLKKNHEFGKCSRNWKKLTNWKNIHEKYTYLKKYIDFESLWLENVLKFEFFL